MAKFYQHLDRGNNLGKVTQLEYIDDVSDDDLILYRFKDGTACSKDFIAAPNNLDAFNGKFVMVELFSPTSQWVIEEKEVSLGETKTYTNPETGETYEIPVPGVQKDTGEYGGGGEYAHAMAKDGSIRITATPPVLYGRKKVEPDDNYILSIHPELSQPVSTPSVKKVKAPATTPAVSEKQPELQPVKQFEKEIVIVEEPANQLIDIEKITVDASKIIPTTINNQVIISNKSNVIFKYDTVKDSLNNIIINDAEGNVYTYNIDEFFKMVKQYEEGKNVVVKPEPEPQLYTTSENRAKDIQVIEDYLHNEDVLITNLIEKSKKVPSEIGMEIDLKLPPKEVYNTVKSVYPENMNQDFIKSLAYRIPIQDLIASIAAGLFAYYDGEKIELYENSL